MTLQELKIKLDQIKTRREADNIIWQFNEEVKEEGTEEEKLEYIDILAKMRRKLGLPKT